MLPTEHDILTFTRAMLAKVQRLADALYGTKLAGNGVARVTTRAARSYGGRKNGAPYVSLNLGYYIKDMTRTGLGDWHEYKHIDHDAEIGGFKGAHWCDKIAALVIHEVAHQVQFCAKADVIAASVKRHEGKALGRVKGDGAGDGHGEDWQAIYRDMRPLVISPSH